MTVAGETTALAPAERHLTAVGSSALSIQEIIAQKKLVAQCVSELMRENEHFGVIPGTEKKDDRGNDISKRVLFKSGADLLCSLFQLVADYEQLEVIRTPTLIYYRLKCTLTSASSGIRRGSGLGSCNSHEEKYIRAAGKKCPQCNKETVLRSRPREGDRGEPGWFCWAKKGGCGANFVHDADAIVNQETGIKDPADLDNTILKMAAKRSRVDAVLTVTGASDFFTQDVEDLTEREAEYIPPPKASADPKAGGARSAATASTPSTAKPAATSSSPALPKSGRPIAGGALPANDVKAKPGDPLAKVNQVTIIHTLREKIPGWAGDHAHPEHGYSVALRAYKKHDGSPCASSKELTYDQAANLIRRMQGKVDLNVERGPNRSQVIDISAVQSKSNVRDLTRKLAQERDIAAEDILSIFGVDSLEQLNEADAVNAYALVSAWGTEQFDRVRDSIQTRA